MRSLKSRKYVTEIFTWRWHYYSLTPEGVKYLREYLGLPDTIIPNTHKEDTSNRREDEETGAEENREGRSRGGRGFRGSRGRGGRGRGEETTEQTTEQ